jgi:hypothetical protein
MKPGELYEGEAEEYCQFLGDADLEQFRAVRTVQKQVRALEADLKRLYEHFAPSVVEQFKALSEGGTGGYSADPQHHQSILLNSMDADGSEV